MRGEPCDWCGEEVLVDDGFRAVEPAGERYAVFCRLEHIVPWVISGAHWEAGAPREPLPRDAALERCVHCGEEVGELRVLLIRHRGEHRVADAFCRTAHLLEWAKAGGRFQASG